MEVDLLKNKTGGYCSTLSDYELIFTFDDLEIDFKAKMTFLPNMRKDDIAKRLRKLADVIEHPERH